MSERAWEVPWAIAGARGICLDVGCVESDYLGMIGPVDGIDCRAAPDRVLNHLRHFFLGDIREFEVSAPYDTVLAISTLEHIGLAHDPYGTPADDPEFGDRRALEACVRAGKVVLVSVPFGAARDYGWFRQYDLERLKRFTDGMDAHWSVHGGPRWAQMDPKDAEEWEYDHDRCSARAVAVMMIGGAVASPEEWKSVGVMRKSTASLKESQFSKDRDAYQRLRKQGLQPPNIDGCATLEAQGVTRDEIMTGVIKGDRTEAERKKEAKDRRAAWDRARELQV